ncbi:amidohydrolase [Carboxylicivirga sp. RSCT41]|uniref:amidohydrolase n=1 Tax=Carboxylicivirga agarovorans TaxID=3417570 RepID=UPI003D34C210
MKKDIYGCACCSPQFGEIFKENKSVGELASIDPATLKTDQLLDESNSMIPRRTFIRNSAIAAGSAFLLPGVISCAKGKHEPATVFKGGTILTVDGNFSQAEAIAIRNNKIIAVGDEKKVLADAGKDAKIIDLKGKIMLPGFIDPHTHVVAGSVVDSIMDYVGMARFGTVSEVLEHLKSLTKAKAEGEWVVVRNFDPSVQTGPDELTFTELDAISTQHPIFLLNASGHLAYANSKAFEVAGITEDIENPPGAEFVRDANGQLTGVMKNNVTYAKVLNKYPAMAEVNPSEALLELLEKWSRLGLTTASELALGGLSQSPADVSILRQVSQSGRLNVRLRSYPFYSIGEKAWDAAGVKPGDGDALSRIAGYKLVADGSNQGYTGLQREPYLNSDSKGLAYMAAEDLKTRAIERAKKGWHLAIHGNGDAAIDNILNACKAMRDAGIDMKKVRVRIEHCSILHDEQIALMKDLGVSASFLIGHVHYWGVAMRDEIFGEEKARLLDRYKSAEEAGVGFTLHSDFMVTDPNPLHMIEMAVTRRTWKEPDYKLAPEEAISVEMAIRALTSEAAWQLFSEHEIGSIEVGKLADLVILDKDPRKVNPDAIKDVKVLETWMNGKKVYSV